MWIGKSFTKPARQTVYAHIDLALEYFFQCVPHPSTRPKKNVGSRIGRLASSENVCACWLDAMLCTI